VRVGRPLGVRTQYRVSKITCAFIVRCFIGVSIISDVSAVNFFRDVRGVIIVSNVSDFNIVSGIRGVSTVSVLVVTVIHI